MACSGPSLVGANAEVRGRWEGALRVRKRAWGHGRRCGRGRGIEGPHGDGAIRPTMATLSLARLASLPLAPLPPASALSSSQPQPWLLTGFQGRCLKGSQHGFRLGNSSRRLSNVTIAAERPQESTRWTGTRKVMEHLVLYKMKGDITDEQEKDMLDHLYSLQYHYRGILAVSLGSVVERMPEGVTRAFFQRFPSFEALEQYMDHPARLKITDEFISPFCKGIIEADFEAEVEDDLEPLFRRGDQFQQGIEHVVLIKLREGASQAAAQGMLDAFNSLPQQIDSSVIVQLTAEEALETFSKHPAYRRRMSSPSVLGYYQQTFW